MKRRGATAQRISEKEARKGASLTRHCIAKDGSPVLAPAGRLVVSNPGALGCTYPDCVHNPEGCILMAVASCSGVTRMYPSRRENTT